MTTALITTGAAQIEQHKASLVEQWRASLKLDVDAGNLAPATAETYGRGLAKFITWGEATAGQFTDQAIKQWLASLRSAGSSQNAISVWFAGVRSFFRWAASEGHIAVDPSQGVKRGRRGGTAQMHKREMLTDDEMTRILSSELSKRDRALLHLLAYTGARGIELHRADIEDLKTDGGLLVLFVQGKGRIQKDERVVIAHPDAVSAIYDYLAERKADKGPLFVSESNRTEGERLSSRALRMIVRDIFDRAGITSRSKSTHSIRHSAVSSAIRNGASLSDAQAMARHASVATTQIYFHNLKRLENAAEKRISYGQGVEK